MDPNLLSSINAGFLLGVLKKIFSYNTNDFPPCHAKPLRSGRGFPWNKIIMVHTQMNGEFTMEFVEAKEKPSTKRKKKI